VCSSAGTSWQAWAQLVSSADSVSIFTDYVGDALSQVCLKALDSEPPVGELLGATSAIGLRHTNCPIPISTCRYMRLRVNHCRTISRKSKD
jgi:hypothetical protein